MRIWHKKLIRKLCRQHLLAMWREGLGAYKIIVENKKGYRNHPAVKEFENAPLALWWRLSEVQDEMIERGYNPKEMPEFPENTTAIQLAKARAPKPWQNLETQIEILKEKGCACKI